MIENIKDLERLLKLCRKQGVTEITLDKIAFKLGELPKKESEVAQELDQDQDLYADLPDLPLTQEELAIFANSAIPAEGYGALS